MSRVHDALRRSERAGTASPTLTPNDNHHGASAALGPQPLEGLLELVETIPYRPSPEALLVDALDPDQAPVEEFRAIRTRLNHLQSLSPIHTAVITSPSPAEGKSFTAVNLALAHAQLSGNRTLLCDFDLRHPVVHKLVGMDRAPGVTDYIQGKVPLHQALRKLGDTDLYVLPSGTAVINPLELLNLKDVKQMLERLPRLFNWILLDSPPLLFAADANLLSTLSHGTILVVRIGATTTDAVTRAMQSLCQNNVLGIIVNGTRRGELYSKYTYYHSDDTEPREKDEQTAIPDVA